MKKWTIVLLIIFAASNLFPVSGTAIDFKADDIEGNTVELSKFKGKIVILDFWATWCPPCIKEIPNLKKIYSEFKGDEFEIISIALERKPKEHAVKFVEENEMDWIHIIDKDKGREIATDYKIQFIPTMYVIGKDGKIAASGLRGENLKKKISELLK